MTTQTLNLKSIITKLLLAFTVALGLAIVMPTLTGFGLNSAYAWDGSIGIGGGEAGTNPKPGGGYDGPGPGGGGTGTGEVSRWCNGLRPYGQEGVNYKINCVTRVIDYRTGGGQGPIVGASCVPSPNAAPYTVGVKYTVAQWIDDNSEGAAIVAGSQRTGNIDCLTLSFSDATFVCLNYANVNINMTTPQNKGLSSIRAATPWGNGDRSYNSCFQSGSLYAQSNVPITEYGRYAAQFQLYGNVVRWRTFNPDPITGMIQSPEMLSDSGPQLRRSAVKYLEYNCSGVRQGASPFTGGSWTWTETDCGPDNPMGNPPTYQCVGMEHPTLNGIANTSTAQIFRDGNVNQIRWNGATVTGNSLVSLSNPLTNFRISGTPTFGQNRLEVTRNGQPINNVNTTVSGIQTAYDLKTRWASDKGTPLNFSQTYTWTGVWNKQSVSIVGVDFDAEDFIIGSTNVQTTAQVQCSPRDITFDVLRATNG